MAREDEVKLIAYRIWEEEGCPDGQDCDHWYRAEAIWELQQPKAEKKSSNTESRQAAKPNLKVAAAKKKSK